MVEQFFSELRTEILAGKYDFLQFNRIDLTSITDLSAQLQPKYRTIIIVGFGASSLNSRALASAVARPTKKIVYLDSIDALEIEEKLNFDLTDSIFFIFSKSGNTKETYLLAQYLLRVKQISPKNTYIIAPRGENLLFKLSTSYSTFYLEHEQVSSGRFGIISASALLPCILAGVDGSNIIALAADILSNLLKNEQSIIQATRWHLDNYHAGKHILIILNYCYQLDGICRWQQQLIAESLGKEGFGITPMLARGTFDEHSQLQLYLDGPKDKFYKIIRRSVSLPAKTPLDYQDPSSMLAHTQAVHSTKVYNSLLASNCPVILDEYIGDIDEKVVAHKIIETLLMVMMIAKRQKLNPFNQPAVDKQKNHYNDLLSNI